MRTRKQRARYYADGRVTVGTISTLNKTRRTFHDWFVGKLRGTIVMHPKTRRWKFSEAGQARAASTTRFPRQRLRSSRPLQR